MPNVAPLSDASMPDMERLRQLCEAVAATAEPLGYRVTAIEVDREEPLLTKPILILRLLFTQVNS